ncbi:molybdenum cofactor guanylyltransferase [Natronogracilivirga saccharolytica]|uniref:Probable molybdenum cofactor guanylyltransferase n=1 Tax=Natronogracilivirga saccharolytica TaxID=2812953 RepID=A0A8J7RUP6_9BACT|nr:molybdenum cofactor guanylyltransferase [Natronogracilivirga saccharolytica]MBP3193302.1 molybdenum cofactor guanylyltransferase [Natronogracilivirga saccharolytica]
MTSDLRTIYILAGGHSRRMGTDKAMLPFGGQTLLEYQIDRCRPFFREVVVLSGQRNYPVPVRHIHDIHPDGGPVSGIHSALRDASEGPSEMDSAAIMAVDLPMVSAGVLRMMASTGIPDDADALVADAAPVPGAASRTGKGNSGPDPVHYDNAPNDTAPMDHATLQQMNWMTRQPLLGIYSLSVNPELESYFQSGDGSVMGLLDRLRVKVFPVQPAEIRNINTHEEYEEIRAGISPE